MSKILGIDYGAKRIGLALAEGSLAVPFKILPNQGWDFVLAQLREICQAENIKKIVVGLPLSLKRRGDNSQGARPKDLVNEQMREVLDFIDFLKKNFSLDIKIQDERLTSEEAMKLLKGQKSQAIDDVAAMLILQSWLDSQPHFEL